jgi:hypothetical protein
MRSRLAQEQQEGLRRLAVVARGRRRLLFGASARPAGPSASAQRLGHFASRRLEAGRDTSVKSSTGSRRRRAPQRVGPPRIGCKVCSRCAVIPCTEHKKGRKARDLSPEAGGRVAGHCRGDQADPSTSSRGCPFRQASDGSAQRARSVPAFDGCADQAHQDGDPRCCRRRRRTRPDRALAWPRPQQAVPAIVPRHLRVPQRQAYRSTSDACVSNA